MDNDTIAALAREYAEETVSHTRLSTTIADDTEDVIRFLLRRFYLIKKSDVKDMLETAMKNLTNELERPAHGQWGLNQRNRQMLNIQVAIGVLNHVFPEIAKEVE